MTRATSAALLALCLTASGCVADEAVPVRLDLCPSSASTAADSEALARVTGWTIEVWGLELGDVAFRRILGGGTNLTGLVLDEAIPREQEVRLFVQGRGPDETGASAMLAVGVSGPLILLGAEQVCLCIAPPERYEAICPSWSCRFDVPSGRCQ